MSILSLLAVIVCCLPLLLFIYRYVRKCRVRRRVSVHVCVVLGSGGHTTELLRLVDALGPGYSRRSYVLADTDGMSQRKLIETETRKTDGHLEVHKIPRSREVRQSYTSSVLSTAKSLMHSLPLMCAMRPDLVLCNGPGTCIPICFWAFLLDLCCISHCDVVFIESVCRVHRLSLSGQLLYWLRIADRVLVQWPNLEKLYPRAIFMGRL